MSALTGCGDDTSSSAAAVGDVPTTPRALAWLASERLGEPDVADGNSDLEELGPDAVATLLRYGRTDTDDGDSIGFGVVASVPKALVDCTSRDNDYLTGCREIAAGVVLQWQEQVPEEDPGTLNLIVTKDDVTVVMYQSSAPITGDPRRIDLPISVDAMVELAQDPRVGLTTTQEAVDAGEDLDSWSGS